MLCLETPRLFLRDYTPADLEAYFQLKADPEAMYYLPGARLFTREAAAARPAKGTGRPGRQPAEMLLFPHGAEALPGAGWKYWIHPAGLCPPGMAGGCRLFLLSQALGKGLHYRGARQVLSFAFVQGKVYRMSASCFAENAGSERVLQKCGFTQEAGRTTFRRHGGERKPRVQYRLLKEEWASL